MLFRVNLQNRFLMAAMLAGSLCFAPVAMKAQAQQAAAGGQAGQKNWKDRDEYDLYNAINSDTNPQSKLQKLNQWKDKYPTSDYADVRRTLYLTTYVAANQPANAMTAAKDILAVTPDDFTALYYTTLLTMQTPNATPAQMADGQKAANGLLNGGLDKQFAPDKKPANVSDDQWKQTRTQIEALAHTTIGWVSMQQKQNEAAEAEFKKSLAIDPNQGNVNLWMGTVIIAEKKPETYPVGLFYMARAANYDGNGALPPQARQQTNAYVKKAYDAYHGSDQGFSEFQQMAKANPAPPADFKIASTVDLAKAEAAKEQAEAAANPALALWKTIKQALQGADGASYFESSMKEALLPGGANGVKEFSAKVVSMEPETRPKTVVVALEDGTTPDATLKFEEPLPGKVDPGTVLTFSGVPQSYTATPFMVVFNVDKENLHGWTGTNPRPRAPAKKAPAKKQ